MDKNQTTINQIADALKHIKLMRCEKIDARITEAQCLRNFTQALNFDEHVYLNFAGRRNKIWGACGCKQYIHPNIKKCNKCLIGENLYHQENDKG